MQRLVIEKQAATKHGKTRRFSAVLLAYLTADPLWQGGQTETGKTTRPVLLMVAESETALRPFMANIRLGRKAEVVSDGRSSYSREKEGYIQLLKSAGYSMTTQRVGENTIATFYLPELFNVDPGMVDPEFVRFVMAPPRWWVNKTLGELGEKGIERVTNHLRKLGVTEDANGRPNRIRSDVVVLLDDIPDLAGMACYFAQYLDRRTRKPIPPDPAFYAQLYIAALACGMATWSAEHENKWLYHKWGATWGYKPVRESGTEAVGLLPMTAVNTNHETLDELMARQIRIYRNITGGVNHGAS